MSRTSHLSPFRAALRFARRDAWAAKGRSSLIMAMIAIPVAGLSGVALVGMSMLPTTAETVTVELGQADARITIVGSPDASMVQSPTEPDVHQVELDSGGTPVNSDPDAALADPKSLLPAGWDLTAVRAADVTVRTPAGIAGMTAVEGEVWNPAFAPKFRLVDGRAPETVAEVLATAAALDHLGVDLGESVTLLDPERTVTVVGVLDAAQYSDATSVVFGRLGAFTGDTNPIAGRDDFYLFGHPLDWAAVQKLNAVGAVALSRSVLLDPPPSGSSALDGSTGFSGVASTIVTLTLAGAAFAVLEVALLAGAAFAVGARQQQRVLATVASVGGRRKTLFQIVSASGLVLGFAGGIAGVALGVAGGSLYMVLSRDGSAVQYWGYHLSAPILIGIALFATVIGWMAALVPAWSASRLDVVVALTGARRPPSVRRGGLRWIGVGVVIAGVAITGGGAYTGAASVSSLGIITNGSSYQLALLLVLAGPVVAQMGVLVIAPVILTAAAGLLSHLGRSARLAGRDAVRNRARSVPVLAAIMSTVFLGTLLLAFFGASDASARAGYERLTAEGQLAVDLDSWTGSGNQLVHPIGSQVARLVASMPGAETVGVLSGVPTIQERGPADTAPVPTLALRPDVRCDVAGGPLTEAACGAPLYLFTTESAPRIWVGTVDDLALILDAPVSDNARNTLRTGGAVSLYPQYVQDDGTILINWIPASATAATTPTKTTAIPAVVQKPAHPIRFGVFMLAATAVSHALDTVDYRVLASFSTPPDGATQEQLRASIRSLTGGVDLLARYEQAPASTTGTSGWALMAVAALIAFGAAAVALGLARADSRRDDSTLSAIGANPGMRRAMAFWQSALLAGTGALLGGILGLLGPVMIGLVDLEPFAPPWAQLAILTIGLPVVIASAGWLLARPARFDEGIQRTIT
ncbi:ABC transporter permease [Cryobacterium zhongshanensis]|uniref:ABC transporter permease n=1 Tax=Cryobacterium zhongshanensis TaxID=2928153 RepID=A0AA41UE55_9MICO|nr:ABC transporter permease [Cryobacterium zhongshanensis]MCI4657083.1 ABC transporter permease [Cryobacterium zhongshanensis]